MKFKDICEITVYKMDTNDLIITLFEDESGIKQVVSNDIEISIKMKNPSEDELIK